MDIKRTVSSRLYGRTIKLLSRALDFRSANHHVIAGNGVFDLADDVRNPHPETPIGVLIRSIHFYQFMDAFQNAIH